LLQNIFEAFCDVDYLVSFSVEFLFSPIELELELPSMTPGDAIEGNIVAKPNNLDDNSIQLPIRAEKG
jgi:hypothetical protein